MDVAVVDSGRLEGDHADEWGFMLHAELVELVDYAEGPSEREDLLEMLLELLGRLRAEVSLHNVLVAVEPTKDTFRFLDGKRFNQIDLV